MKSLLPILITVATSRALILMVHDEGRRMMAVGGFIVAIGIIVIILL